MYETKKGWIEKIVPFNDITKEISKTNIDYLQWKVLQTKESKFLPTNKNITLAFILNLKNNKELLLNSIQGDMDENVKKKLSPKWFYDHYVKDGFHNYDAYETNRELAILFGIPSVLIEGICVNRVIEKDKKSLNEIKEIFPNCYICNINGKVIAK